MIYLSDIWSQQSQEGDHGSTVQAVRKVPDDSGESAHVHGGRLHAHGALRDPQEANPGAAPGHCSLLHLPLRPHHQ